MSGLILKLAPFERLLINGAVIENGDRRARISIRTANTNVLRLKDAVHPQDAMTPVSRACYFAQLILSGDVDEEVGSRQLAQRIDELGVVFRDSHSTAILAEALAATHNGNTYLGLRRLRQLLSIEEALMRRRT